MSYLFFNQLERVLNILVYSLTPTRFRHRRFDRNRYYRTLLQWDICSNRYVNNRFVFNQSLFSQASLHSLAALSSNQRNANYSTSNVIRGELPILSTQGIVIPPSYVNPILSSIARSLGLTTHSAAVTNGLVILILREMVRRGPPQGLSLNNITESELRDGLNAILRSASVNPQSVVANFTPESSNAAANHTSFHSQVPEITTTTNYAPDSSNAACNLRSFISPVPEPEITTSNQSCLYRQSSSESSTSTSSSSSIHSASSGESYLSVLRELLSSPEFILMSVSVIIALSNLLVSPDIAPTDGLPQVPSNSEVTGSQLPSNSEVRDSQVPSNSEVRGSNNRHCLGFSTKSIILSSMALLTFICLQLASDVPIDIDPQIAFPT